MDDLRPRDVEWLQYFIHPAPCSWFENREAIPSIPVLLSSGLIEQQITKGIKIGWINGCYVISDKGRAYLNAMQRLGASPT